ncbi:hypothetical protein QA645_32780 [Bradyrhizobium sp. CIAT3101]|uniref:hypothetical protein n=1 Tax=Bradyrhizobium sp. CIAT3101 TaxID=439387 RepID=UPI0024B282A7|nr:hypothetical protein [Bradyrhizobium sp. CIAT3101]WFU79248.1 hypothetical protein QA645_32780 [Bradyrhizobium sp. CIAT3101]
MYSQIGQGVPSQVSISADGTSPKPLFENALAVRESRFTYAIDKLLQWSSTANFVNGVEAFSVDLQSGSGT